MCISLVINTHYRTLISKRCLAGIILWSILQKHCVVYKSFIWMIWCSNCVLCESIGYDFFDILCVTTSFCPSALGYIQLRWWVQQCDRKISECTKARTKTLHVGMNLRFTVFQRCNITLFNILPYFEVGKHNAKHCI